jgi:hypothetical protein
MIVFLAGLDLMTLPCWWQPDHHGPAAAALIDALSCRWYP